MVLSGLLRRSPWWFKIMAKLGLSLLPMSYERLRGGLTGYHGGMERTEYAREVFRRFSDIAASGGRAHCGTLLELGPGGSLLNGIYFRGLGFETCHLIDVGSFARGDAALYRAGLVSDFPAGVADYDAALARGKGPLDALGEIGIHYHTDGLTTLRTIATDSVDFSFSNAVLEHVRRDEFGDTARELARVHRAGSLSAHQVDYRDHLGGGSNHLRLGNRTWESRWFRNDGFYTNRLSHGEVVAAFVEAGFECKEDHRSQWERPRIDRQRLHRDFEERSDEDLLTWQGLVVLERRLP